LKEEDGKLKEREERREIEGRKTKSARK